MMEARPLHHSPTAQPGSPSRVALEQRPLQRERGKLSSWPTALPPTFARTQRRGRLPRRHRRCSARLVPSCAALTRSWRQQEGLTIPQPTSSPPTPVRLSSASRLTSSGWSGSTTAALEKALVPESVNNADPSGPLPVVLSTVRATLYGAGARAAGRSRRGGSSRPPPAERMRRRDASPIMCTCCIRHRRTDTA